tara:strand:- start:1540 stop:2070 length:531 start_codon:yes stop_codon:yes gene_type:complete
MADKKIVLMNVEVCWAKLQEPDNKYMSEEMEYSVAIKMNDQLASLMSDYKLNKKVKSGKDSTFDGGEFISIALAEKTSGGWTRFGEVYDKDGVPSDSLIGNGSKVNMFVTIGDSSYGNIIKLGHLSDMNRETMDMFFDFCQIQELVDFEAPSAVIRSNATTAAVDAAPVEEMSIEF